jgi:hypothetical protein
MMEERTNVIKIIPKFIRENPYPRLLNIAIKRLKIHNFLHFPSKHYVIKIPCDYFHKKISSTLKSITTNSKKDLSILLLQTSLENNSLISTKERLMLKPDNHIFKIPLNIFQSINECLIETYPHKQSWEWSLSSYNNPIIIFEKTENLWNTIKKTYEIMINEAYQTLLPNDFKKNTRRIFYPLRDSWIIENVRIGSASKFLNKRSRRH